MIPAWLLALVSPSPSLAAASDEDTATRIGLGDLVREWLGDGAVADVVDLLVEPALQIVLIVLLALIATRLLRRMVGHAVEEMRDPDHRERLSGVRRRIGLGSLQEGRVAHSTRRAQRADALGALARSVVAVVIWTIAVFTILGTFGVQLGPLIAGAGIIGVALGFGAQSLVKDFLSGIFMLVEDQYGVGDVIDVGPAVGVVEGVGLRTTRLRDVTGTLWHVPNGEIARVGNMSQEWSRALLDIGVAYDADVDEAAGLVLDVANQMAHEEAYEPVFLADPEIWGVERLGDSSVDIRLVIKTQPGEQWALARELRRRIKLAFDQAEVEIPFPQRTVWIRSEDDQAPARTGPTRDPAEPSAARGKAAAEEGARATSDEQTSPPDAADGEAGDAGGDEDAAR